LLLRRLLRLEHPREFAGTLWRLLWRGLWGNGSAAGLSLEHPGEFTRL